MKLLKPSASFQSQILATICADIIALCYGMTTGWLSPVLPILKSSETPLVTGPLTVEQASWIGSIFCISAIFGIVISTFTSDRIGTKYALQFLGIPFTVFWLMVLFGNTFVSLCIARLACGLSSGGMFVCVPLFNAQIATPELRGQLGSMMQLFNYSGILFSYIIGTYVDYRTFPLITICVPICFTIVVIFLPETPQSLIKRNNLIDAEKSFRFYRGISKSAPSMSIELAKEFEAMTSKYLKSDQIKSKVTLADFKSRAAVKGMTIGFALMFFNQFTGSFVVVNYAATIFEDAGSSLSPNVSSIIIAVSQIGGCCTAALLIDRIGRRILMLISMSGITIGFIVCGTFSYLTQENDLSAFAIIPIISLSFVIFMACLGVLTLPYVILSEILPSKLRSVGSLLCLIVLFIFTFLVLKYFPILNDLLELYGCMWIFAGFSLMGVVFTLFILPETKGKNLTTQ